MNDDKLKELEEFCKKFNALDLQGRLGDANTGIVDANHIDGSIVPSLIAAYRQLEKDKDKLAFNSLSVIKKLQKANAELLAVLKPFAEYEGMVELSLKDNLKEYDKCCKAAHKVFDKHKGE